MKKRTFIVILLCMTLFAGGGGFLVTRLLQDNRTGKAFSGNMEKQESDMTSSVSAFSIDNPDVDGMSGQTDSKSRENEAVDSKMQPREDMSSKEHMSENVSEEKVPVNTESESGSVGKDASKIAADDILPESSQADSADGSRKDDNRHLGESLSVATARYDPDLLLPDGRRAYDYTMPPEDSIIDYCDFTIEDFVQEVAGVYQWAHNNHFQYGNSVTLPPCEDGLIACDRLISRSLWNLGVTDQPQGGVQVYMKGMDEEYWFTRHGFIKINDTSLLQRGDIVFQQLYENGQPITIWHNFVLTAYDPATEMCEKYDCGHFTPEGLDRISQEQPFHVPLADYGDARRFVCGFRLRQKPEA